MSEKFTAEYLRHLRDAARKANEGRVVIGYMFVPGETVFPIYASAPEFAIFLGAEGE